MKSSSRIVEVSAKAVGVAVAALVSKRALRRHLRLSVLRVMTPVLMATSAFSATGSDLISLAGTWRFQLDPDGEGESRSYFNATLKDSVKLPGSTDENEKGTSNVSPTTIGLNRRFVYEGPAWYQRDIEIPEAWKGKRVELLLERTRFTRVWFDDASVGGDTSLSTPHRILLTKDAVPGVHRLTIEVNNDQKLYPMHLSHVWADRIQTNWNGILGRIELIATDAVRIHDVQIYPDIHQRNARVELTLENESGGGVKGRVLLDVKPGGETLRETLDIPEGQTRATFTYALGSDAKLWDEHDPNLYQMTVRVEVEGPEGLNYSDEREVAFGLREFSRQGKKFAINGQITFLRGKHDAGVFPLTGYASMEEADWERMFRVASAFGINFFRFHSWCPPEAAFRAADRVGMYLQPELSCWGSFSRPGLPEYLRKEGEEVLRAYGNHPSFVMLTLGNELVGDIDGRRDLVQHLKERDNRRLYAQGSNNNFVVPEPLDVDDFWTVSATSREGSRVILGIDLVRGSMLHPYVGHLNNLYPPATTVNYERSTDLSPVPLISHETGQYQVFPDFGEIEKYTGVLRPYPMEVFRERLGQNGMLDQAHDFFMASGKLAAICYKEDIESVLRTRDMGGFALLDLQDYPGQGTALVGMCNAFMEPKAFVEPEWFRQFCAPVVPLLMLDKRTWTNDEVFRAGIEVAQYHREPLVKVRPIVRLKDMAGKVVAEQSLSVRDLPVGGLQDCGEIEIALSGIEVPQQLTCEVLLEGTEYRNEYDVWVYPSEMRYDIPKGVEIVEWLDESNLRRLRNGATMLVLPRLHDLGNSIDGQFITNFWTIAFFKNSRSPGTLGLLMDPEHPVFRNFPTEFHSNWQWWPMARYGRPVIMDGLPDELRPMVQVIDNFETSRKLGLLFEGRLGKGRFLFSSIDFLNHRDKPEVRQLLFSMLRYMESEDFNPKVEVTEKQLENLFRAATEDSDEVESAVDPGIHG